MIDLFGILTRTLLALAPAPHAQPQKLVSIPLMGTPDAGVATEKAIVKTAPTATETVDKVQGFYAGIKQVTAQFRQTVTNVTFGSTKSSDGTVYIQKPGKMRWDYVEKRGDKVEFKKSFISNGAYLFVVEHDNKQVVKKNLNQDLMPVAVSFLYGKGDLKAEFNAELDTTGKYGGKDEVVLKLSPKAPSAQYKNLFLVVSPKDFHVTQSIIVDSSNNVNHFRFFAPNFTQALKDAWFEFDVKSVPSYRVIDADQQKPADKK
ncbi:MAG: outer membrane lipoprotein carrier protein LolA [Proteobacteria bacterium]|nr:outer membrane lipoprotein carrier protein LolA [Pseudomonadota bacterium]